MNDKVWITWEIQQRNRSMSAIVGANLHEITSSFPRILRYPTLSVRTIILLYKNRKNIIFLQNPSIVLCMLGLLFKVFFKITLVVDEHNAGLWPLEGRSRVLNFFAKIIVRKSSLVIVTNENLKLLCEEWGGEAFVMPDPLPKFPASFHELKRNRKESNGFKFLFICSWASDEPYENVFRAFEKLKSENINLVVSGNFGSKVKPQDWPNIELIGFVSREKYFEELFNCDAVIVLTNRSDCLNCGAYEAVAAEKPGLLSDSAALRRHFKSGFYFTDNSIDDICVKAKKIVSDYNDLSYSLKFLKRDLNDKAAQDAARLSKIV